MRVMDEHAELQQAVRPLQVILAAMILGMVAFAVIALAIGPIGPVEPGLTQALLVGLVCLVVTEAIMWSILRRRLVRRAREMTAGASDDGRRTILRGYVMIAGLVPAAMAEGLGLFGAVIYLLTGAGWGLATTAAATVLLIVLFPTSGRVLRILSNLKPA
jgi:hypothetical protein